MNHEILLGLTTTPHSDWHGKTEEMKKFGIKKIALFPAFLGKDDRRELYKLLEEIDDLEIPHVHLRGQDMDVDEIKYLKTSYGTEVFNSHSTIKQPMPFDYGDLRKTIYLENNVYIIPSDEELKFFGGLCLDFSHLENARLMKLPTYENVIEYAKKFKIGCCHISAIKKEIYQDEIDKDEWKFDSHTFASLEEFAYVQNYKIYLPKYLSLELENSFEEQLRVKEYLENKLSL